MTIIFATAKEHAKKFGKLQIPVIKGMFNYSPVSIKPNT